MQHGGDFGLAAALEDLDRALDRPQFAVRQPAEPGLERSAGPSAMKLWATALKRDASAAGVDPPNMVAE